jgi:hypothetical protein
MKFVFEAKTLFWAKFWLNCLSVNLSQVETDLTKAFDIKQLTSSLQYGNSTEERRMRIACIHYTANIKFKAIIKKITA